MANRLLRREHIVAASLVGAVVVVVGYASGFGVRPATGADVATGNVPAEVVQPPVAVVEPQAPSTTPAPAQPVANPVVPRPAAPAPAVPLPTIPAAPPHPHPTEPTVPTVPSSPLPVPPPDCEPGFVPVVLDTLLGTLGEATGALGLPLLGAVPLDAPLPVVDGLIGTCVPAPVR